MKRRILLGLTGSVATILYEKLIKQLSELGDVNIVLTERANHFVSDSFNGVRVFREEHEWQWKHQSEYSRSDTYVNDKWKKDDDVLHIKLRDNSSALVIAPCSVNTLAKIANGICDNLLTTIARAWDFNRPFIIVPAANSLMWSHPITGEHIAKLRSWGIIVIEPQTKMLACGTYGKGAMADIDIIKNVVKDNLIWKFPLMAGSCSGIPTTGHPGAFSTQRKHEKHTGVDLYTESGSMATAVEAGKVISVEHFTGPQDNSPWWNDTDCILIEGATGVVCYGEISTKLKIGDVVRQGDYVGHVKSVLKDEKARHDICGHRTSMLHMELYPHGTTKASNGFEEKLLNDPTPFLLESVGRPDKLLTV